MWKLDAPEVGGGKSAGGALHQPGRIRTPLQPGWPPTMRRQAVGLIAPQTGRVDADVRRRMHVYSKNKEMELRNVVLPESLGFWSRWKLD